MTAMDMIKCGLITLKRGLSLQPRHKSHKKLNTTLPKPQYRLLEPGLRERSRSLRLSL